MKPEDLLPVAITSITPQKNNPDRYSIFVDGAFLIGVTDSTLLKHQLEIGLEITPALFKQLQRDEGRNAAKNYMLKLISRREHARKELQMKAQQKGFSTEMIESVLNELEEKEFINDERFALKYAQNKNAIKQWGPYKINTYLHKKGVNRTIAEAAVKETFEPVDLKSRLQKLALKKKKRFLREEDLLKRKQKVIRYLVQKGYSSNTIYQNIDELMQLLKGKN